MQIDAIVQRLSGTTKRARHPVVQMMEDSVLPSDIVPPPLTAASSSPQSILLTGATGFLGAWLLQSLLQETEAHIYCLTRSGDSGFQRIRANLESYGIWSTTFADRITAIAGDLNQTAAGMSEFDYEFLARSVDSVYHCGAAVNWIHRYRRLAGINVRATRDLLRFACTGKTKAFHFVSSSSVCYATTGPRVVDEHVDMLPYIETMHLGYAQTKCVAEALVRQAGERGLPVSIYRPALLSGDSVSGHSNSDDFLSRFLKGCIVMGSAPELDWTMDCCPVNTAAESIVRLSERRDSFSSSPQIYHLVNTQTRTWRECILWINLFGYPVRLIPYSDWKAELSEAARLAGHPLRELSAFFCRPLPGTPAAFLPRLYEDSQNIHVAAAESVRACEQVAVSCPALDSALFDRYFASFIERGFLQSVKKAQPDTARPVSVASHFDQLCSILGRTVSTATPLWVRAADSIITELTSWRYKTGAGLFPYRVQMHDGGSFNILLKVKPRDTEVLDVAESIARLCSETLGEKFAEARDQLEFVRCDVREAAVYAQTDPRFRQSMPVFYGAIDSTLALEYLTDVVLKDSASNISGWTMPAIAAVIEGLAEIHAVWLGRHDELMQSYLGKTLVEPDVSALTPFWGALAEHARPWFAKWTSFEADEMRSMQEDALHDISGFSKATRELLPTLTHNDFNPRNLALRESSEGLRLCAYDWELARVGLPQHDLAEFLCFVLSEGIGRAEVFSLLEMHRSALERAAGLRLDPDEWKLGFKLSLQDLLVNRFAMYTMAHRFRVQPFLPRVLRVWRHLLAMLAGCE